MGLKQLALAAACAAGAAQGAIVTNLQRYPGSRGILVVGGRIKVDTTGTGASATQTLNWRLMGIDPNCGNIDTSGTPNACGIHLHQGTSCDDATQIGGHKWNAGLVAADPWATVTYSANAGVALASATVVTGLTEDKVLGSTLVIHDEKGGRIACGIVMLEVAPTQTMQASLARYPSYMGNLLVSGTATIKTQIKERIGTRGVGVQKITFSFTGGDPACGATDTAGRANACGIHIHEGASCASPVFIAQHAYNKTILGTETVSTDPWEFVQYSSPTGAANADVTVITGMAANTIDGAVVVVHDSNGVSIGCGVIVRPAGVWGWVPVVATTTVPQQPAIYIGGGLRARLAAPVLGALLGLLALANTA